MRSPRCAFGFPPANYLIGAQKAGTTSLAVLLAGHPELILSSPKEPDFFAGNWERGWDWYRSCFVGRLDSSALLDASTSYSMAPLMEGAPSRLDRVPERIAACRPDARFIYMIRDPVERAWSAYWHAVRAGWEKQSFERAIHADSLYVRASRYSFQIGKYRHYFGGDSLLYIDFRNLRRDPRGVVEQCLAFLNLPAFPEIQFNNVQHNRSFVFRGPGRLVATLPGGHRMLKNAYRSFGHHIPDVVRRRLRSMLTRDIPTMDDRQRRLLEELLEEEYDALRSLTEIKLR